MTGTVCSIANCNSNAEKAKNAGEKLSFFSFPSDIAVRKEWIRLCQRKDKFNPKNKRVCSKHFTSDDYVDAVKARILNVLPKKLKRTAVPSLNLLSESAPASKPARAKVKSAPPVAALKLQLVQHSPSTSNESQFEILQRKYDLLLKENEELRKRIEANEKQMCLVNQRTCELQNAVEDHERILDTKIKQEPIKEELDEVIF